MTDDQIKTIKLDGKEWLKLTKTQATRLGLDYCWDDGLLVHVNATKVDQHTFYYNCHPDGRSPVCDYYTWWQCAKATDELVDLLVASEKKAKQQENDQTPMSIRILI